VIRGGLCEQDRIDTALEVLLALRNDPVDDAFGLTEEEVEWASSVPWIEGEPWVVSVARLVKERDAAQGDTAPTEGMTQQEILAGLTGVARRLEQAARQCSNTPILNSIHEAEMKGAANAYTFACEHVAEFRRQMEYTDKHMPASEVTDAVTRPSDAERDAERGDNDG